NTSNSFACCSAVMPMPVSTTASSIQLPPLATLRACSLTSPCLVNLQALLSRLSSICRSHMGSTVRTPRFSWASTMRRFLFFSASCPAVPMTSLISGASCTVCGLNDELRLVLVRLCELATLVLDFVEQPHVLDRYHRLVGEGGHQLDFLSAERPHGGAGQDQHADRRSFAQQRNP